LGFGQPPRDLKEGVTIMIGRLRVIDGADAGREFPFDAEEVLVIGRGRDSSTNLKDPHASRIHCELRAAGGRLVLVDCFSTTKTFLNDAPIAEHELKDRDLIRIGKTTLRVELGNLGDAGVNVAQHGIGKTPLRAEPAAEGARVVGSFEVGAIIAKGETGVVYYGTDQRNGKPVAIKFLSEDATGTDEEVQRFVRAMKTVVSLKHTNIIAIHGAGRSQKQYWVAMEYVPGESVTRVIERIGTAGMLDWRITHRIAYEVAQALDAAHAQHIVHRNLSPRNILLRQTDGVAKLGDLMLAKATEGLMARSVTRPGQLVGSIAYMSPERTLDETNIDTRSDLYSLGATIYALLTGRPPFQGKSLADTIRMIRETEPVRPKKYHLAVPDLLEGIVLRLLAKRPDDRYKTPSDLIRELQRSAKFNGISLL
jgi:serine/threonine protein kinase